MDVQVIVVQQAVVLQFVPVVSLSVRPIHVHPVVIRIRVVHMVVRQPTLVVGVRVVSLIRVQV